MKQRGFTLIEIIGVITILGIITIMAVPSITGMLKRQKDNEYQKYLSDIYLATEVYLQQNQDTYHLTQKNQSVYIKIDDVIRSGYLKSNLINPKTNQKIDITHYVKITLTEEGYLYNYLTETPDLTPLTPPTFCSKTVTETNVTLNYAVTDNVSRIKDTYCYYGKTNSDMKDLGTIGNNSCVYPPEAAYAKVCIVNNSGMYSCSDTKQLATYLIQDGNIQINFSLSDATMTQNNGYVTLDIDNLSKRKGMYTTELVDFTSYGYIYIDLDVVMTNDSITVSNPYFQMLICNPIEMPAGTTTIKVTQDFLGKVNAEPNWTASASRKTYGKNLSAAQGNYFLEIRRNSSLASVKSNIYNVWMQLTN